MWFCAGSFSFSQNADGHRTEPNFQIVMKNPQENAKSSREFRMTWMSHKIRKKIVMNQNSGYNYPIRRGGDVAILDAAVLRVL